MAIQVNGTQVIGNSRELTNIASVDATTVAAMAAAGVGGGKANAFTLSQTASGTFTVPIDCTMVIQLIGGGGSGGRMANQFGTAKTALATGGASGGSSFKKVTATAGQTFTVVIGSGAYSNNGGLTNTSESGNSGGNSTVTGTGVSMTANGGGGGTTYIGAYDLTKTINSNAGGSASGGDTNLTGNISTAAVGYSSAYYTFAVGCSAGAAAGYCGPIPVNTKVKNNGSIIAVSYAQGIIDNSASDRVLGSFHYYQTEVSMGSSAFFSTYTQQSGNYPYKRRYHAPGDFDGWFGKLGGGSGGVLNSAFASTLTSAQISSGEGTIQAGDGVCLFTMFTDL